MSMKNGSSFGRGYGGGKDASSGNSYHNGGVEGSSFDKWYDDNQKSMKGVDQQDRGDRSGRSDGRNDHRGSGGSNGGGRSARGSNGGKDHNGRNGSGGTKGHDGNDGSGGTKGGGGNDGSGGTKGGGGNDGSGGTKGGDGNDGSGGTKGGGGGSGGTNGSGDPEDPDCGNDPVTDPDSGKVTANYVVGKEPQLNVSVTATPTGTLFITVQPASFDGEIADLDGMMFNMNDGTQVTALTIYPSADGTPITGFQTGESQVEFLSNGASAGGQYDAGVQFGLVEGSTEGAIMGVNFTLSSNDGPLTLADIDLNSLTLIVDSDGLSPQVLNVAGCEVDDDQDDSDHPGGSGGTSGSGSGGTNGSDGPDGGDQGNGSGGTNGSDGPDGGDDQDVTGGGSQSGGTSGSGGAAFAGFQMSVEDLVGLMNVPVEDDLPDDGEDDEDLESHGEWGM